MLRRAGSPQGNGAARPVRRRDGWRVARGGVAEGAPAGEVEKALLGKLESADSADNAEEAALALAGYYLDAARPLEALTLFERVSSATADRGRREFSQYFLCRLDGKRLEDLAGGGNGGPYGEVLEQIFYIYLRMGNAAVASRYLEMIIGVTEDPEVQANCLLALGRISEGRGDHEQALGHYAAALRRPPGARDTSYLLNDGVARCLIAGGRYAESEGYCRRAIGVDPSRHGARETLAASLRGQGRYAEAAENLVLAVELHPASAGALRSLEELVDAHEEVADEIPDIARRLRRCRELSRGAAARYVQ